MVQTNKYGRTVTLVTREIKNLADRRWISAEGQRGHLSRIFFPATSVAIRFRRGQDHGETKDWR